MLCLWFICGRFNWCFFHSFDCEFVAYTSYIFVRGFYSQFLSLLPKRRKFKMWRFLLNLILFRWVGPVWGRVRQVLPPLVFQHEDWFFRRWWSFIHDYVYHGLPWRFDILMISRTRARSRHCQWTPLGTIVDNSFHDLRWDPRHIPVLLHVSISAWDIILEARAILPYFIVHQYRHCTCMGVVSVCWSYSSPRLPNFMRNSWPSSMCFAAWIERRISSSCWFGGGNFYTLTGIGMDSPVSSSGWLGFYLLMVTPGRCFSCLRFLRL